MWPTSSARERGSAAARGFANKHIALTGAVQIPGIEDPLHLSRDRLEDIARAVLPGVREAGRIYRRIARSKGEGTFITEVSMDEAGAPQSPEVLLVTLAALADEGVPVQTIAPRFSGYFHKGVDYVGDVAAFAEEVDRALCVIRFAQRELGLPSALKLSLHSGSDKFSLYGPLRRAVRRRDVGLHLKTAGTTWLEELIGLCEGGDDGLEIAKDIYTGALTRVDELCRPYATVIAIDPSRLPPAEVVARWDGEAFIAALRHDPSNPRYNPHLRQLLHVAYKLAAEMGDRFLSALERHEGTIFRNVTENIYQRHLIPVFLDEEP
ncbi:MAG: tagaturonate epimerase family protein [Minicystis sp.]